MNTATVNITTRIVTVTSTGSPGRPGVIWENDGWQTGRAYALSAGLQHNGSTFRSIAAHMSSPATEPGVGQDWTAAWALMAEKGGKGDKGDMGDPGEKGDKGDPGPPGQDAQWTQLTRAAFDSITPEPGRLYVVIG